MGESLADKFRRLAKGEPKPLPDPAKEAPVKRAEQAGRVRYTGRRFTIKAVTNTGKKAILWRGYPAMGTAIEYHEQYTDEYLGKVVRDMPLLRLAGLPLDEFIVEVTREGDGP